MSEFWDSWWKEHLDKFNGSRELDYVLNERKLEKSDFVGSGVVLVTNEDWPVLLGGYPGLRDWQYKDIMPALAFPLDSEFGHAGILLRSVNKKLFAEARVVNSEKRPLMYGFISALDYIWKEQSVILVEGGFDLIPIRRFVKNSVCLLTDNVSVRQAGVLSRYCKSVGLMLDNDMAGRNGSIASKKRLINFKMSVYDVIYGEKDPGKLMEKDPKGLQRVLVDTMGKIQWLNSFHVE